MNEMRTGMKKIVLAPGTGIAEKMRAVKDQELLIAESRRRIQEVFNSQLRMNNVAIPAPVIPKGKISAISGYIDPAERGHYVTHRPAHGSNKKSEKKMVYGTTP